MKNVAFVLSVIGLILVSLVGVGVAYTATIESGWNSVNTNSIYCTTDLGQPIISVKVQSGTGMPVLFYHENAEDPENDISEDHFTLTYSDMKRQDGIVLITITGFTTGDAGIVFSIHEYSDDSETKPYGAVIGSCIMVSDGKGKLTGTIGGIGPIPSGDSLKLSAKVTGTVSVESTLDMSIMVYPIPGVER